MRPILRFSRYFLIITVVGCIVMFGVVTIYAALAVGGAVLTIHFGGYTATAIATMTVSAFKILDLFLLGTIFYIVALGLAALFLDGESALPPWFKVGELQDLKVIVSQTVVVVLLVAFLGDVLEWENGTDIAFVGGGVAAVIAAIALMLRSGRGQDTRS